MTLLSVSGLDVSIYGEEILKDITFNIDLGEVFGFVGESGSGKSMTALALMNLLPKGSVRTGQAAFEGNNLFALSEKAMCKVRGKDLGMIFQEPMTALNPVMTIGHQVAETLIIHGNYARSEAMTIAREKLARVEMPASRFSPDLYPHEISGGQRQRVCIALAIALRPKILIADEPTTALDVSTQAQILDLLKRLVKEEQMSLLFITHDLAVIARMADKVAVMQKGRIVETGPTRDLFQAMKHAYTRKLFAASNYIPAIKTKTQGNTILEVSDVVRSYKLPNKGVFKKTNYNVAIKGVSFAIRKGESIGLVGESGCGKSTLSRTILGLDPLQNGRITVDGVAVRSGKKMPHSLRRKMQIGFIIKKPGYRTSAVVLGIEPPDKFPLIYYRDNCADIELTIDDVIASPIVDSRAVLISGTGLSKEPSRSATLFAAEQAKCMERQVFLDLDFRADQWHDPRAYGINIRLALRNIDIAIGTEEEIKAASLTEVSQVSVEDSQISNPNIEGDMNAAIANILNAGPKALVVKRGSDGADIHLKDGKVIHAPPFPVEIYNTLGAGDAFASGFIYGILNGWDWQKSARLGNATGAIVVTRHGCANFMPTMPEVNDFVEQKGGL